jgi:hypothetical protein
VGNKAGWIVAGALLLGVLGIVTYLIIDSQRDPDPSAPTVATTGVGALDFKDVSVPITTVLTAKPSAAGNAADDYVKAIKIYKDNESILKNVSDQDKIKSLWEGKDKLTDNVLAVAKQIDEQVAAGATKASMNFTLTHTPKDFRVGWRFRPADDLEQVARLEFCLAGDYVSRKEYDAAQKILMNLLAMGMHMTDERARSYVTHKGIMAQADAIQGLGQIYMANDPEGRKKVDTLLTPYNNALNSLLKSYETKLQILQVAKPEPGDVFNIAQNDKDKSWRIQAILTLGVIKFVAKEQVGKVAQEDLGRQCEADRKHAQKLIDQFCASQDPLEQAAAQAAKAFDKEKLQTLATDDAN